MNVSENEYEYSWQNLFDFDTLYEGEKLYRLGKAKKPGEDENGFYATVRDDWNHRVKILDDGYGIYAMRCDCDEAVRKHFCRHMAAALMLLEDVYEDWYFDVSEALEEEADRIFEKKYEAETAAKEAASASSKQASGRPAAKAAKDSPHVLFHREGLDLLQELSDQDSKNRAEAVSPEDVKARAELEEYHFFDAAQFRKGFRFPMSLRRDTEKLIQRGELGKTEFSLGNFRIPRQIRYYQSDQKEDDTGEDVRLRVIQHGKHNEWVVEQIYSWNTLLYSRCQNWGCFSVKTADNSVGHELCCHEYAALLVTEQYLEEHNIGDITSDAARSFLSVFNSAPSQEEKELPEETLKAAPQLRIDDSGHWSVQFQVGTKRLYKIKNLTDFLQDMEQHKYEQFGKNTTLQLGKEFLDEHGLKWVTFIEKAIHSLRLYIGNDANPEADVYFYDYRNGWQKLTDRIPLVGEILDHFVDAMKGEKVEAERSSLSMSWRREKEKFTLTAREGHLRPTLTLDPCYQKGNQRFDGVVLKGELPEILRGSAFTYAVEDNALIRVPKEESDALEALYRSADKSGMLQLRIGRTALSDFYRKALPKLREFAEVEETDPGIPEKYLPEEAVFVCYLDVDQDCVLCKPFVFYGTIRHSPFDVYGWKDRKKAPEHYRDTLAEANLMDLLTTYLPERDVNAELFLTARGELPLFEFLDHGLTELLRISEVKATDRFMRLKLRKKVPFSAGVSVESGVMDLTLTSEELTPDELVSVFNGYKKKLSFVRLKNGDFLRLDQNEEIAKLVELMKTLNVSPKDFAKGKMEIPLFRALYLDLMLEQIEDVYAERDSRFKKLVKEFKTVSDADYAIPDNLKSILRKYQMTGYRWLRTLDEYHFGGILADDMGLGKTLQAIAVMLADHNEIELPGGGEDKPVTSLVVCPASLVYNWEEELHRFAPALSVLVVVGSAEERKMQIAKAESYDVLVTSYDLLKRDIAEYEEKTFRFELIDEAQYIKNHNTAAAKSVKLIRARARFALTGTPIENRLSELWSIFDYLMPGFLYDYSSFRNEFEQPIVKQQDREALERLKRMVSPFVLRRSKKEVLKDLPDKLEEIRYAGFEAGGQQQKLYNAQVVRMREDLQKQTDEDFSHSRIEILAELMRIRQICCDPGLVFEAYSGDSAKREACMELIRSCIEGEHKALLFSQFTSMLALLEKDLQAEHIPYYVITGATPKEKRLQMAKAFNSDDTPVFLISLKAGGTGLNLTGADVVIHYDPWWNAAVQNQATDRAHRIGQDKVVTVYQLILRNTIEERIVEMQQKKRALAEDILSAEAVGSAAISREELLALLG